MSIFDRSNLFEFVVADYFETLNRRQFTVAASLFASDGILLLPTEDPIVGQASIVAYLAAHEQDRYSRPRSHQVRVLTEDWVEIQVWGEVSIPPFGIDVVWIFLLNPDAKIQRLQIRLQAPDREAV